MKNLLLGNKYPDNQDIVDQVDESMRTSEEPTELFEKLMSDLAAWGKEFGYEVTIAALQKKSA